ncbi:MAG TPA: hypothetical protein VEI27_02990 [Dehalococcoidales bacterium]|nr:hypothetical protein [Dehalococcoidales bacterium]
MGMDWQVTATTVYCASVDAEVTLLVSPDWSVKCTGLENARTRKSGAGKKTGDCKGIDCSVVTAYLNKLKSEENKKAGKSGSAA